MNAPTPVPTSRSGTGARRRPAPPVWLWVGLCLVAVAWWVAWFGPPPIHFYTFFPLWLGYILTVDGLVHVRAGASLLTRSPARWALLFAFSIPLWWLFEWANQFLGNWRYVMPYRYAPLTYFLLSSLAFSTVMPAIFETATLLRTFAPFRAARRWLQIAPGRGGLIAISLLGAVVFAASLLWPSLFFPLVWIGGFLLLDPINRLMGSKSIAADVARGQWGAVLLLWAAGLVCGFFWEMWNAFSMPKWVYEIPFAADPKLFEMPVLGYGGYLPFALEVYAVYNLLHGLLFRRADTFLPFGSSGRPESPS